MFLLSANIKISVSSKSGHSTFVLSTIDMQTKMMATFCKLESGTSLVYLEICGIQNNK